VARLAGDIGLRYRPAPDVDLGRLGLWGAQLVLDARAEDIAAIHGTNHALAVTRVRVIAGLDPDVRMELDWTLEELDGAIGDEDFEAIEAAGEALRELAGGA
jgi:hypothetical protein